MTPDLLLAATGCTRENAARYAAPLSAAMARYGIDTPLRQAAFLGQVAHESGTLAKVEENLNYSAERLCQVWPTRFPSIGQAAPFARNPQALAERVYGGRMGNSRLGDGWRYRGRGLIQLTGRAMYEAYADASGVDVLTMPDLLTQPEDAAGSAGFFWRLKLLNGFADARDWSGLTRRINAGTHGLEDRIARTQRASKALGVL